jgi:hypothetical protein
MRAVAVLLLLPVAACWGPRYFVPRERVVATAPDGSPAAMYVLPADAGEASGGEVRAWSRGAEALFDQQDREVVHLHVGFELENNGAQVLQLDLGAIRCEDVQIAGAAVGPLAPLLIAGDGTAPAGQTARVDLTFELATNKPSRVDGFAVRFVVREGERVVLQQVTPFWPWYPVSYHDPYWDGWAWGWGVGVGFAWHGHYCR